MINCILKQLRIKSLVKRLKLSNSKIGMAIVIIILLLREFKTTEAFFMLNVQGISMAFDKQAYTWRYNLEILYALLVVL